MAATGREQQLEQRVAELEHAVAQLIRATYAAVGAGHFGGRAGSSNGWQTWRATGADLQVLTDLHAYLQDHPAPAQERP